MDKSAFSKLKIAVVASYFYPDKGAGAVRLNSIVKKWSENKCVELSVYTKKTHKKKIDNDLNTNIRIFRFGSIASNKKSFLSRFFSEIVWSIRLFIKLIFSDSDVFFVSSPLFIVSWFTVLAGKLMGKKCIVDIRDLYPAAIFETNILNENSLIGKILKKMELFLYNNSCIIFVVTEGLKQNISKKTDTVVKLACNGYISKYFSKINFSNKANKPFRVIFHGNFGKLYDFNSIIKLAVKLKDMKVSDIVIDLIGDGSEKMYLMNQREKYNLYKYLTIKNSVDNKYIPEILDKSDLGIVLLKRYSLLSLVFPVKVYEYIAAGIPTIISNNCEASEFVSSNIIGIKVANNDIDTILEYIHSIKNSCTEREKIKKRCDLLKDEFSREKIAEIMLLEIQKQLF